MMCLTTDPLIKRFFAMGSDIIPMYTLTLTISAGENRAETENG